MITKPKRECLFRLQPPASASPGLLAKIEGEGPRVHSWESLELSTPSMDFWAGGVGFPCVMDRGLVSALEGQG